MKKIINDPERFVDEVLDGILLAHPDALRAVQSDRRGLVRADAAVPGKVGIVTGGGSGHLPVFLGYVGRGLLDGAAVGNVFSSPSARQIADVTRAVDGGAGVLYLYGNYGGDVYNFDIAADLVGAEGIETATVLATDDVASAPADRRETRRGVAGMIYSFKLAGAAAERGDDLASVAEIARRAGANTRTMGVGLSPTILPAAGEPTFELPDGEMELGIGIHGEPGIHRGPLQSADAIADRLLDEILADLPSLEGASISLLVNGLGATPLEELYVLYRHAARRITEAGATIHTPFVGNYVTSLEMAGASISVLMLDDELAELLDAPAVSPFFRHGEGSAALRSGRAPATIEIAEDDGDDDALAGDPSPLGTLLLDVLGRLPRHADELRDLDAALGDGDLGITVSAGATAARAEIARDPGADDATLLRRLGAAFASANPSTFAALVGGGIISASGRVGPAGLTDRAAVLSWARDVAAEIARRGKAEPGDKTVLDAIGPTLDLLSSSTDGTAETAVAMLAMADAAVAELTTKPSGRGRAAWLRERSIGLKDPGMVAYRDLLADLAEALKG